MSFDTEVILLIGVGLVILFTLVASLRVKRQHRRRGRDLDQFDDVIVDEDLDAMMVEEGVIGQTRSKSSGQQADLSGLGFNDMDAMFGQESSAQAEAQRIKHDKKDLKNSDLIVMYVMAKPGKKFVGYELLQSLLAAGLRFGDMSIFHRHEQANGQGKILFSLASATEPGIFDMSKMGGFACQGLTMFMQLTQPKQDETSIELMLKTAEQLAEDLDGVILDHTREPLTAEMGNYYRSLVRRRMN